MERLQVVNPDDTLQLFVYQQELERIKFVVRKYLRIRIQKVFYIWLIDFKIEKFHALFMSDPYEKHKLSDAELGYCER